MARTDPPSCPGMIRVATIPTDDGETRVAFAIHEALGLVGQLLVPTGADRRTIYAGLRSALHGYPADVAPSELLGASTTGTDLGSG